MLTPCRNRIPVQTKHANKSEAQTALLQTAAGLCAPGPLCVACPGPANSHINDAHTHTHTLSLTPHTLSVMLTSVKRFLRGAGRSRLPASVAGFMAASRRKLGWRGTPTMSPLSAMVTLPLLPSSKPAILSKA